MAKAHSAWIHDGEIAGGGTETFQWNNPPGSNALHYFAFAKPDGALPGTKSTGEVGIVAVRHTTTYDGDSADTHYHVEIDIKNFRKTACGYSLYQGWTTGS